VDNVRSHRTMSSCTEQSPIEPNNVRLIVSSFVDSLHIDYCSLVLCCLISKIINCVKMPLKRTAKRKTTIASSPDSSSAGDDNFIVSPRAHQSMRRTDKAPRGSGASSSSQPAEEE
jgi:hypothetical protein